VNRLSLRPCRAIEIISAIGRASADQPRQNMNRAQCEGLRGEQCLKIRSIILRATWGPKGFKGGHTFGQESKDLKKILVILMIHHYQHVKCQASSPILPARIWIRPMESRSKGSKMTPSPLGIRIPLDRWTLGLSDVWIPDFTILSAYVLSAYS